MQPKKVTDPKEKTPAAGPRPPQEQVQQQMQMAYQVHTLAQYLYGQFTPNPWTTSAPFYSTQRPEPTYWRPYAPTAWTNPTWTAPPTGLFHAMDPANPFGFPR